MRFSLMLLRILAAIITGIGGHYLNRKWDRAILFLCLYLSCWILSYVVLIISLQQLSGPVSDFGEKYADLTRSITGVSTAVIFIFWLISLIVTIVDAKKHVEPNIVKWTPSGITGALFTSFLSFVLLAYTVSTFVAVNVNGIVQGDMGSVELDTDSSTFLAHNFYVGIYFGGESSNSFNLPSPPEGEGILKGKIVYHDQPAVGVSLTIVLNSKYKAKDIVTDSEGIFTLSLPPGVWRVNSIRSEKWENKPKEGEFSFYYGGEEKFDGKDYNPYRYMRRSGYPVDVTTGSGEPDFNITISDDIQLQWPDPELEGVRATLDDTLKWSPYPRASQYLVKIEKITRDGDTTHYEEVAAKTLTGVSAIPLSSFKHRNTGGSESTEYAVKIYAFAEDGTPIANSGTFHNGTFLLSEGNILIKEELDEFFGLSAMSDDELETTLNELARNKKRAEAVSTLLEDNMLTEAETLLALMDSEYAKGRKEVLTGYVFALKGDCGKAEEMFSKAEIINPNVCIPDEYKVNCE